MDTRERGREGSWGDQAREAQSLQGHDTQDTRAGSQPGTQSGQKGPVPRPRQMQSPSRSTAQGPRAEGGGRNCRPTQWGRGWWAWPACTRLPQSSRLCLWVPGPPGDLSSVRTGTSNLQGEVNSPSSRLGKAGSDLRERLARGEGGSGQMAPATSCTFTSEGQGWGCTFTSLLRRTRATTVSRAGPRTPWRLRGQRPPKASSTSAWPLV